ncbi:glutathione S-transferase family protein [Luteimonas vadosa]|uniref:Glutathione S-transferase family protein n=1 Tax=Luteimonas vadosa TaxID=1165507 RepID=A0ABP9DVG7_9GAMM
MGVLVEGSWQERDASWTDREGRMRGPPPRFRNWITPDGEPGPTGEGGFPAEPGRYRLMVSLACPWSHRATLMRRLKGLEELVGLSVTHWLMGENGWTFDEGPGVVPDPDSGARYVWQVYACSDPTYSGPATVPVLWDSRNHRIVNNASADIMRMLNDAFDGVGANDRDYYPAPLRDDINAFNTRIHDKLNEGVYQAGFASSQAAYDEAVAEVFDSLDWLEKLLGKRRYLCHDTLTEADWRLFPTLVRFDAVYHGHFKCNVRRLVDHPRLWDYARRLYQHPGVRETVDFEHIKRHYYQSHPRIDPTGIVPAGPAVDWEAPAHG